MNSVKFGDYDSWSDFGLILTGFSIGFPAAKRYTVDVPGRDGVLDLTDVMYENPVYEMRTHTFTFRVRRGRMYRTEALSNLMMKVHGQTLKVSVYDDPDWYWYGHCEVDAFTQNQISGDITIKMEAEPYKCASYDTIIEVTGDSTVALWNEGKTVTPEAVTTAETTITVGDSSLVLSAGTWTLTDFKLATGWTEWAIETSGTVTITYQQKKL